MFSLTTNITLPLLGPISWSNTLFMTFKLLSTILPPYPTISGLLSVETAYAVFYFSLIFKYMIYLNS